MYSHFLTTLLKSIIVVIIAHAILSKNAQHINIAIFMGFLQLLIWLAEYYEQLQNDTGGHQQNTNNQQQEQFVRLMVLIFHCRLRQINRSG